jgi:CheY-specific phosphatase CheX
MSFDPNQFPKAMLAVRKRACTYLHEEIGLNVTAGKPTLGVVDALNLREMTAVVWTSGPVQLIISFSFDRQLLERMAEILTCNLDVDPDEREQFLSEIAAETANLIVGHATADLAEEGNDVLLTPPVIICGGRRIHRPRNAMFASVALATDSGSVDVGFIGPAELFDQKLNALDK